MSITQYEQERSDLLIFDQTDDWQEKSRLGTVNGYLVDVNYEKHRITLMYPPTSTEVVCHYGSIGIELSDDRRRLLQVTGNVIYNDDGETPVRISYAENIEFLDLSKFIIASFFVGDKQITFAEPLILTPSLTDSCQFITLQDEQLGIDVIAQTREELEDELRAELSMLWKQSQMPDHKLGKVFQSQKRQMLAVINEEVNGNT